MRMNRIVFAGFALLMTLPTLSLAADIAYIFGRVAFDGAILEEGEGEPFDPMLLSDTGDKGLSEFELLVQGEGHSIEGFRDKDTLLTEEFLSQFDAIVFGLHQKIWSQQEKNDLDSWLNLGGGMLIYSDSASGGSFRLVGAQNPVGQNVTNNLIADYGMQVTVDQADGVRTETAATETLITGLAGLELQGEGVSPVAIAKGSTAVDILIPYTSDVNVTEGLTIEDPDFASLALRAVGDGHIIVMFDRQPMWNNGPGSNIEQRDNRQIVINVINFLSEQGAVAPVIDPSIDPPAGPLAEFTLVPTLFLLLDD